MKNKLTILALGLCLSACSLPEIEEQTKLQSEQAPAQLEKEKPESAETTTAKAEEAKKDSLRDPYHEAYLSDLSLEEIGLMVLKDEVPVMDNLLTFRLMDTLLLCGEEDLPFYLAVFQNILAKSDGALAEAMGLYCLNFMANRPEAFHHYLDTAKGEALGHWADFIVYEMYFTTPQDSLVQSCKKLIRPLESYGKSEGLQAFEDALVSAAKANAG